MHLVYIPVIHTKDENGNSIDKICCRDFWKGRDSYRNLQNAYFDFVKNKGFDLERGLFVEETNREHLTIQQYKNITNFENTKETLKNIKLELPEVPELKDIRKVMINREEKIINEIIKPKDDLINKLHQEKLELHNELSKQAKIIEEAEKYQKERDKIIEDNENLNNTVKILEKEYKKKNNTLDLRFNNRRDELEKEFEEKAYNLEYQYKNKVRKLEKENSKLHKIINKFYETIDKFIHWICIKFDIAEEDVVASFEGLNDFLDDDDDADLDYEVSFIDLDD